MEETNIARKLDITEKKAEYDEQAKYLLSEKIILSHILAKCVVEYKGMKPKDIVPLIEGNPVVSKVRVKPGETNCPEITGCNTEDAVPYEEKIVYDIRFHAYAPDNSQNVKIIIDVEAQKSYYPGYDLVTRGFFYDARMVSAQLGKEFVDPHFDDLKKVISIWICMNSPRYAENTITRYYTTAQPIVGDFPIEKVRYDIMEVITVCLSKDLSEEKDPENLHRLLGSLLSMKMTTAEKKCILQEEYDIPMTKEMEERSDLMCNLSQAIFETGENNGTEKITRLNQYLTRDKRFNELFRSFNDPEFQQKLLKEYNL